VLVAVWQCRSGNSFGDFPGGSRVGWRSKAEVEIPIVFPVLLVGTELRPTRRAQYGNCDPDCQCTLLYIRFWPEAWASRRPRRWAELYPV